MSNLSFKPCEKQRELREGEASPFPEFIPEAVQKAEGTVLSVFSFTLANQPAPFIQLILQTNEGNLTVELGPEWYLNYMGFSVGASDFIRVTGSLVQFGNKRLMRAREIRNNGRALKLRDEKGHPLWAK